jgi:hypothetical protein
VCGKGVCGVGCGERVERWEPGRRERADEKGRE